MLLANRMPRDAATILTAILTLLTVAPIVGTGLTADDIHVKLLHNVASYDHRSLADFVDAMRAPPALPFAFLDTILWWFSSDILVVRTIQVLLVVMNVTTFTIFARILTGSATAGGLAGLGVLLAIEFRKDHDAIIGAPSSLPIAVELSLLAMIAYALYCRSGGWRQLLATLLFQVAACCANETALILTLAFAVIDVARRRRPVGALIITAPSIAVLIVMYGRRSLAGGLEWINAGQGVTASTRQLLATIPGSYRGFGVVKDGTPGYFFDSRFDSIPAIDTLGSILVLLSAAATFVMLQSVSPQKRIPTIKPLSIGAVWLCASALTHDIGQWSTGLPLGEAYSSVYVGFFGFGFVYAAVLLALLEYSRVGSSRICLVIGATAMDFALVYGNQRVNARVIAYHRNNYETIRLLALSDEAGIFKEIRMGSVIAFDKGTPLPIAEQTDGHVGNDIAVLFPESIQNRYTLLHYRALRNVGPGRDIWVVRRELNGAEAGGLTLAYGSRTPSGVRFSRARYFRPFPNDRDRDIAAEQFEQPVPGLVTRRHGSLGSSLIEDVKRSCGPTTLSHMYRADEPSAYFSKGFVAPNIYKRWNFWVTNYLSATGQANQDWRYAGQDASVTVSRSACVKKRTTFSAWLFVAAPGHVTVSAPYFKRSYQISVTGNPIRFSVPATAPQRFAVTFFSDAPVAPEELGVPHANLGSHIESRLVVATVRVQDTGP